MAEHPSGGTCPPGHAPKSCRCGGVRTDASLISLSRNGVDGEFDNPMDEAPSLPGIQAVAVHNGAQLAGAGG